MYMLIFFFFFNVADKNINVIAGFYTENRDGCKKKKKNPEPLSSPTNDIILLYALSARYRIYWWQRTPGSSTKKPQRYSKKETTLRTSAARPEKQWEPVRKAVSKCHAKTSVKRIWSSRDMTRGKRPCEDRKRRVHC